jgi:hypothetical protein
MDCCPIDQVAAGSRSGRPKISATPSYVTTAVG